MPRIAPDANDVLVWYLNDVTSSIVNSGTAGAAGNLSIYGNPVKTPALVGGETGFYIPGNISPNHDSLADANTVNPSPNVSVSGWVFLRRYTSGFQSLINKQYAVASWASPFVAIGCYLNNTTDGRFTVHMATTGGVSRTITTSSNYVVPLGRWSHVGCTWDGTTLRGYLNGVNVLSLVPGSGAIDYGSNPGKWLIGAVPDTTTLDSPPAIFQDVRVANVARPQSYFANIYFNGFMP